MAALSVKEQDERLRAANPSFRLTIDTWWMGVWEGELTPICQTYRVRIRYFPYRYWPNVTIAQPHVTVKVINPLVAPDPRGTGELTPHVYRLGYSPEIPALCVWDPVQDEWDSHDYIVDTIVPWTIKWLLFYEDWLDTGIWQGRGRHPELQPSRILTETPVPSSEDAARSGRLFHAFGRHVGLHVSGISLAVAREGRFVLDSWPDGAKRGDQLHATYLRANHPHPGQGSEASASRYPLAA